MKFLFPPRLSYIFRLAQPTESIDFSLCLVTDLVDRLNEEIWQIQLLSR